MTLTTMKASISKKKSPLDKLIIDKLLIDKRLIQKLKTVQMGGFFIKIF